MVTEVVLKALIKILLGPGVFYSKLDSKNLDLVKNTNLMLVDNIKFCLNFFCLDVRKNISPGIGGALVCQVARLQVLGNLIHKYTKTKSLANNLSTGDGEVGNGRSKGNSSRGQKTNSKTSKGGADIFKVEFTWVTFVVSSTYS